MVEKNAEEVDEGVDLGEGNMLGKDLRGSCGMRREVCKARTGDTDDFKDENQSLRTLFMVNG